MPSRASWTTSTTPRRERHDLPEQPEHGGVTVNGMPDSVTPGSSPGRASTATRAASRSCTRTRPTSPGSPRAPTTSTTARRGRAGVPVHRRLDRVRQQRAVDHAEHPEHGPADDPVQQPPGHAHPLLRERGQRGRRHAGPRRWRRRSASARRASRSRRAGDPPAPASSPRAHARARARMAVTSSRRSGQSRFITSLSGGGAGVEEARAPILGPLRHLHDQLGARRLLPELRRRRS